MPKAAKIFAHSFYYEKTTRHFPGKSLSEISLFCMKELFIEYTITQSE